MPAHDLIFDVGLHRGQDTAYYLSKGFRVVAFEANPELVAAARKRFAGPIASGRLTVVSGAIADPAEEEEVEFYVPAPLGEVDVSGLGSVDRHWVRTADLIGAARRPEPGDAIRVPAIDLSERIEQLGMPHYMKVDIEGSDRLCLEALRGFAQRPRYISVEAERRSRRLLRAELDLLEGLGYTSFATVRQDGIEGAAVETTTLGGGALRHSFEAGSSGPFGEDLDRLPPELTSGWADRREAERLLARVALRTRAWARMLSSGHGHGHRLATRAHRSGWALAPHYLDIHARHGLRR